MGSTQRIGNVADSYGIYTYKDDLVWFLIEDHDNWQHREIALRLDPFIKKYIKRLDEEIFAEKPICKPDIFGSKEQDEQALQLLNGNGNVVNPEEESEVPIEDEELESDEETDISEDWDHERWQHLLKKIFDKSRVHTFSVVQLYDVPPFWRVFCSREITEIQYDKEGVPETVTVEWSESLPHSRQYLNFKQTIHLYTPGMDLLQVAENNAYGLLIPHGVAETEDLLGEYDLEDKWTLAIRIRYAQLDIANNSSKTSGFYHYKWGPAISPAQEILLKKAADMASSSQGIGAKTIVLEDIISHSPEHPEFTIEAKTDFIRDFAMACGLPLVYFRSESEGGQMISSGLFSTMDEVKVNKKKLFLFNLFKPYIKTLIFMRWGIELEDIEPFLYESQNENVDIPMDYTNQKPQENNNQNKEVINK